jgi:REP element-mobilizing transposase RayT
VFLEGGIYHVYNRVSRGESVFAEEDEASAFAGLLRDVKERDGLVVFAWCLMSNHYHLALRTGAISLARSMRSLQQRVTRGFNARHRLFGPLWQGRYRAKLVEDQRYLDGLLAYIHLNPVAAGIVNDPAEYRWSGHREIFGRTRHTITDVDEVLVLFGKTRRSARQAYVRAIKGAVAEPWVGEGPGRLPWWRLGRPKAEEDEAPETHTGVAYIDELGRSTGLERPSMDAREFLKEGAAFLGIRMADLAGRGRAPDVVRGRELLATLGVERYGLRVGDIAAGFDKSAEAGSRMVSRGIEKRRRDIRFRGDLEDLDCHIAQRRKRIS